MLHSLNAMLAPALMERLVLVINHVLGSEPVATQRLQPHAQRVIRLQMQSWPALLPAPPALAFRVTPAGMLEWCGDAETSAEADLVVRVDASNPLLLMARAMAGNKPAVAIDGALEREALGEHDAAIADPRQLAGHDRREPRVAEALRRLREHREHDGKKDVLVVDYVDQTVPVLARMAAKRRAGYRALGYMIE